MSLRPMRIVMMSNTYKPFVGGVERSIEIFTEEFRRRGHRVLIVTPRMRNAREERDVIRIPALQHVNGTDFSVPLPLKGNLSTALKEFRPDLIHSHHPYFIGDTAVRVATKFKVPLVYTYHTFFEHYTHYTPISSEGFKRGMAVLATGYANLCNAVIAPSESVALELKKRGVTSPINVAPTGIDVEAFSQGNGRAFRRSAAIPDDAFVLGLISRLAPEKNIPFLIEAVLQFLSRHHRARFILAGSGPSLQLIKDRFAQSDMAHRLHICGTLRGAQLCNAYHAMDAFVFASKTETQGLVLVEAMAAGVPVVALDAVAVRDVVVDGQNGRLVYRQDPSAFAEALEWLYNQSLTKVQEMAAHARKMAVHFSKERCALRVLAMYAALLDSEISISLEQKKLWHHARSVLDAEWKLFANVATALNVAFSDESRH